MIQHSGEHLGTNPTIDEIITEIRSRFSNVMPGTPNIPERVRNYVHKVLDRRGVLPEVEIINTYIEHLLDPKNAIIDTTTIAELIQSNSLTDEQIGQIFKHIKTVNSRAFHRLIDKILPNFLGQQRYDTLPELSIQKAPRKQISPNLPTSKPAKTSTIQKPTPGFLDAVSSIENGTLNQNQWDEAMKTLGILGRKYQKFSYPENMKRISLFPQILHTIIDNNYGNVNEYITRFFRGFTSITLLGEGEDSRILRESLYKALPGINDTKYSRNIIAINILRANNMGGSRGNSTSFNLEGISYSDLLLIKILIEKGYLQGSSPIGQQLVEKLRRTQNASHPQQANNAYIPEKLTLIGVICELLKPANT